MKETRKILKHSDPEDKNDFEVTKRQVKSLNHLLKREKVKYFDQLFPKPRDRHWKKFMKETRVLDSVFQESSKGLISCDQYRRVDRIVKHLKKNQDIKKLILMDGHGRFVSKLLETLGEEGLGDVRIHVVDINEVADEWHSLFLPKEVTCEVKDIFEVVTEQVAIQTAPDTGDKAFVYLNFCGITAALRHRGLDTKDSIGRFISSLERLNHVMISYSNRGATKGCPLYILEERIRKSWSLVCKRPGSFFVTYKPQSVAVPGHAMAPVAGHAAGVCPKKV